MDTNRFRYALAQLFQPIHTWLNQPLPQPANNAAAEALPEQMTEWKTHIQARLVRQAQVSEATAVVKDKPVNRATRPGNRYSLSSINAQASLDLLFPENHSADLSRDPAFASALIQPESFQYRARADVRKPVLATALTAQGEEHPTAVALQKETLTLPPKPGFVSAPQAQPLASLAYALSSMSSLSYDEPSASSGYTYPDQQSVCVVDDADVGIDDEDIFFESLPLVQTLPEITSVPDTMDQPDWACHDLLETAETLESADNNEEACEDSADNNMAAEASESEEPPLAEPEEELVILEPYDEAFSMQHLIRRNRFLSNSINHLASQYFKNAES